jgi:glycosyltransferase involved in cell wall biosynthesis
LIVAGPPFDEEERATITSLGLEGAVQHVGVVTDQQLAGLYANSLALVYPSRYEGFGIPPLEAMACGAAVIAANTSSIPEVVGDAAQLFEPGSGDALTEALRAVLLDDPHRSALIDRGHARAATFSWARTARETRAIYESVSAR